MPAARLAKPRRLTELVEGLPIQHRTGADDRPIRCLTDDSRCVQPDALFIARRGTTTDGTQFIHDAVRAGAVAILAESETIDVPGHVTLLQSRSLPQAAAMIAERIAGNPSSRLCLVGVTGTNGKTTVAYLIRHILNTCGSRCGLIGTVTMDDGRVETPALLTTPGCIELSQMLAAMVANDCDTCVMEVSSHALVQHRTAGLHFDAAVFTNLSGDHIDYHGTMNAYADAKAMLFSQLPKNATAIINADDAECQRMARATTAEKVVYASTHSPRDAHARVLTSTMHGSSLEVMLNGTITRIHLPLIGLHNVENALHAAAVCSALGITVAKIASSLECAPAPPGRYEPVNQNATQPLVLIDYAHTDHALENALKGLRPLVPEHGRLHVVFGCGGDRDKTKRPRMARVASRNADTVVITSDNPRTENPANIISEVFAGIPVAERDRTCTFIDRRAAINHAIRSATQHDIILIAGKGHEDYQIIGTEQQAFDDRVVAAEALQAMELEPA